MDKYEDTIEMKRLLDIAKNPTKYTVDSYIKENFFDKEYWAIEESIMLYQDNVLEEGWIDDVVSGAKRMVGKSSLFLKGIVQKIKGGDETNIEKEMSNAKDRIINSFESKERSKTRIVIRTNSMKEADTIVRKGPDSKLLADEEATSIITSSNSLKVADYRRMKNGKQSTQKFAIIFDVSSKDVDVAGHISAVPKSLVMKNLIGVLKLDGTKIDETNIAYPKIPTIEEIKTAIDAEQEAEQETKGAATDDKQWIKDYIDSAKMSTDELKVIKDYLAAGIYK